MGLSNNKGGMSNIDFVSRTIGWKNRLPASDAYSFILPVILRYIKGPSCEIKRPLRVLDIGCGNGYVTSKLAELGHYVIGIDVSPDGIEIARSAYPHVRFEVASLYDDNLADLVGDKVDYVISLEVVEHLFFPISLFKQSYLILRPGGSLLLSTPYHGYLKNVAISLVNGWDTHFKVDSDGAHIKFFSKKTLSSMASQTGFRNMRVKGAGRLPWLWKSMILIADK